VAVKCHITTLIASRERDKNNEADAPMQKKEINFSGPIDIQFLSNANEPSTLYYNWDIFKNKQLLINRRDKEHRYTFTEAGVYTVKLKASNQKCDDTDSITVTVTESALFVPNVFTPNGDGMNDEFRVAYKSLVSFEAWVFNRWGRRVFYWNDPQKGWDGNINGKKASPGPYFYVIKASGYGLDPKNPDPAVLSTVTKKGDINLLRGKGN
jgi:gliding motility-associated-like protein